MSIQSRTDECKIIWYRWDYEIADNESAFKFKTPDISRLSEAQAFDISAHIIDFSFSKSLGEAAGSFSLTLSNSIDWARFVSPGEWMLAFLASDGSLPLAELSGKKKNSIKKNLKSSILGNNFLKKQVLNKKSSDEPDLPNPKIDLKTIASKLRGILLIQRVGIKYVTGSNGEKELTYVISGKDFGVCMEETDLWFNFLNVEKSSFRIAVEATTSLQGIRDLHTYLDLCFSMFFRPQDFFSTQEFLPGGLVDSLKQWLLPRKLLSDLGISFSSDSFFGNIDNIKAFYPTLFQNLMVNPINGLEGTAWGRLKMLSQPEFHELFTELDDQGAPKVVFRPIPWAIDKTNYPTIGTFISNYKDLASGEQLTDQIQKATALLNSAANVLSNITSGKSLTSNVDFRKNHKIPLKNDEIYSFNIGPDFHNRYNHFLIAAGAESANQEALVSQLAGPNNEGIEFPFRNDQSIKRHGLRRRHFTIASYLSDKSVQFSGIFSKDPQKEFLLEANEVIKDYWGRAQYFYSGSFEIAGKNDTKLGKVIVTDANVEGAPDMVFYLESYVDTFTVDANGTGVWSQSLAVTRGIESIDLANKSGFKDKEPLVDVSSFVGK
jgi:hypothetical protein